MTVSVSHAVSYHSSFLNIAIGLMFILRITDWQLDNGGEAKHGLPPQRLLQLVSQKWVEKSPTWFFWHFFPKRLQIFTPNSTHLLHVPIYARLQIFIQLYPTVTKLHHIKRDHHYMLKMSTIGCNARGVVALIMA